jgi:hypothetical protein
MTTILREPRSSPSFWTVMSAFPISPRRLEVHRVLTMSGSFLRGQNPRTSLFRSSFRPSSRRTRCLGLAIPTKLNCFSFYARANKRRNHFCLRMLKLQSKGLSHAQHILDHWRGRGRPNLAVLLRTALRRAFRTSVLCHATALAVNLSRATCANSSALQTFATPLVLLPSGGRRHWDLWGTSA